jgi:hypothetical protein
LGSNPRAGSIPAARNLFWYCHGQLEKTLEKTLVRENSLHALAGMKKTSTKKTGRRRKDPIDSLTVQRMVGLLQAMLKLGGGTPDQPLRAEEIARKAMGPDDDWNSHSGPCPCWCRRDWLSARWAPRGYAGRSKDRDIWLLWTESCPCGGIDIRALPHSEGDRPSRIRFSALLM